MARSALVPARSAAAGSSVARRATGHAGRSPSGRSPSGRSPSGRSPSGRSRFRVRVGRGGFGLVGRDRVALGQQAALQHRGEEQQQEQSGGKEEGNGQQIRQRPHTPIASL